MLKKALAGAEDLAYRENIGIQCWNFMGRVWQRKDNAARGRSQWSPIRYAGAVIPVVAAGAGGSLVGHLHGTNTTDLSRAGSYEAVTWGFVGCGVDMRRFACEGGSW
jgi:hypothetical protein